MVVSPGVRDQIPITISNTGSKPVTVEFKILGDVANWFDTNQIPKLKELNPDQQFTFQVQFKTPSNVKTGDKQKIAIQAVPREAPRITDSIMLKIEIAPKALFAYLKSDTNFLEASFENLTLGDTISWYWDFGDGFTSAEKSPATHTYKKAGEYIITLTATGPYGSSTYSRKIFFP